MKDTVDVPLEPPATQFPMALGELSSLVAFLTFPAKCLSRILFLRLCVNYFCGQQEKQLNGRREREIKRRSNPV